MIGKIVLRQCPFCGGKAELRQEDFDPRWMPTRNDPDSGGCPPYYVKCDDCGASTEYRYEYPDAVELWNRRADNAEQDWVLCSEKLPDIWERVLVVIDSNRYKSIHTAELQSIEEKSWLVEGEYWYEGENAKQITRWRPIPGLPKGG